LLSIPEGEMTNGALTPIEVDAARLDAAVEALEHRVDAWGFPEDFEEPCDCPSARFGWDPGPAVAMNRTRPSRASAALRAASRATTSSTSSSIARPMSCGLAGGHGSA
jgi:hypothetical protein